MQIGGSWGSFGNWRPRSRGWKNFRRRWTSGIGGLENWTNFHGRHMCIVPYESEAYDLMKLYFETSHTEPGRTTAVELCCRNSQRVKAVDYFRRRAPSWMFGRILNAILPNNLFIARRGSEERSFPPLGLHKGILDSLSAS